MTKAQQAARDVLDLGKSKTKLPDALKLWVAQDVEQAKYTMIVQTFLKLLQNMKLHYGKCTTPLITIVATTLKDMETYIQLNAAALLPDFAKFPKVIQDAAIGALIKYLRTLKEITITQSIAVHVDAFLAHATERLKSLKQQYLETKAILDPALIRLLDIVELLNKQRIVVEQRAHEKK